MQKLVSPEVYVTYQVLPLLNIPLFGYVPATCKGYLISQGGAYIYWRYGHLGTYRENRHPDAYIYMKIGTPGAHILGCAFSLDTGHEE